MLESGQLVPLAGLAPRQHPLSLSLDPVSLSLAAVVAVQRRERVLLAAGRRLRVLPRGLLPGLVSLQLIRGRRALLLHDACLLGVSF